MYVYQYGDELRPKHPLLTVCVSTLALCHDTSV